MVKTSKFIIGQRKISLEKHLPLIIGISGLARSGKDSLAKYLGKKLSKLRLPYLKIAFADKVKEDLDSFLIDKFAISAFTEKSEQKNIIRAILVAYAETRREQNADWWIEQVAPRIQSAINNNVIIIISDVRNENEVKWIKERGGFIIHVRRIGQKPGSYKERLNDPIIKKLADHKIVWKSFEKNEQKVCAWHLKQLFNKQKWSTYGEFKRLRTNITNPKE